MRKRTVLLLVLSALLLCLPVRGAVSTLDDPPLISAQSAIVYEPESGTVLFEKEPELRMLIASTTKIMTAMIVLEHCALNEVVNVSPEHSSVEGSSMYLHPYEYYTVEDLLYGLMLASGNDAAAALADHCAGSMEAFAALMNEKAEALGLQNTHFANSHGLDAEGHYSCARDLALITAAAMENPTFCRFFATKYREVHGYAFQNHNQLLWTLDGCVGGKTGYTQNAGRILVSATEREGMRLIVVTLCDPDDWADHKTLVENCFAEYRLLRLPEDRWDRIETLSGTRSYVRLRCEQSAVVVPRERELRLRVVLPRFVFAPVQAGEQAGYVELYCDGEPYRTVEVCYGETVGRDSAVGLTAWERFQRSWLRPGRS